MNIAKDSPYYSFIVSVFSEKLLNLSKTWEQRVVYTDSLSENIMDYQTSPDGEDFDEATKVIGVNTAVRLLLEEGADLFYIHDNKETLLTVLLKNKSFRNEIKDIIIEFINVEQLCSLPTKWNNNVFNELLIYKEEVYLEKLIDKGLYFKQNEFYNTNNHELSALKNGNLKFFEILLALSPNIINFDHVYTYKENYEDKSEENARKITLRGEIERLLKEDIIQIGTNCYNTANILSKYLLYQDLQKKIKNKDEINRKIKI